MTETCHQLPPSVTDALLQEAARSIGDRPGETAGQRDSRAHQVVHLIQAMQPRDGFEYMLAILAVGHFNLILSSMRDVRPTQLSTQNSQVKSAIVGLDRALLGFVRELRLSRKRPSADQPATDAGNAAQPQTGTNASDAGAKASPMPADARTPSGNGVQQPKPASGPLTGQLSSAATGQSTPPKPHVNGPDAKPGPARAEPPSNPKPTGMAAFEEVLAALGGTPDAVRATSA